MELYDGYTYRINIVTADSTVIVDSDNGFLKGSLLNCDNDVLVDFNTGMFKGEFNGNLKGNIVDNNSNTIVDSEKNSIRVNEIVSKSIKTKTLQGSLCNSNKQIIFDSNENTISNLKSVSSEKILADYIIGNLHGNLYDSKKNVIIDNVNNNISNINSINCNDLTVNDISANDISGNLYGDIYNENLQRVFDSTYSELFIKTINSIDNSTIDFGSQSPVDINFYIKSIVNVHSVIKDLDDPLGLSVFTISYHRDDLDNPKNLQSGDVAGLFSCQGYINNSYKNLGAVAFVIDPESTDLDKTESLPSLFVVRPANGKDLTSVDSHEINYSHPALSECLVFGNGTLSAPIVKVGCHSNSNDIKAQKGMIIFNDTTGKFQGYTGVKWVDLH
jgi:hypothetical protein